MNSTFKSFFLTMALAFPCYLGASAAEQISVHDMFKDLSEDEIVMLMEEGQQYIKYIEEHASPEEQMAFAQMMEETMKNFSEDDFAEIENIVKVVEPRLTAAAETEKEVLPVKAIEKVEEKKAVSVEVVSDNLLTKINKIINSILLRAKSDHALTEILSAWSKKDDLNEMVRLLQALNKKELLAKLTAKPSDDPKKPNDDARKLYETIENFCKRLEIEDKQFTVADSFGLEVDTKTSAANVLKFNKILEFFSGATETLLPQILKFLKEFEPEALKMAKAADEKAKTALDSAKQIEKMKRPAGTNASYDKAPSSGSYGGYNPSRGDYGSYNPAGNGSSSAQDRRAQNKANNQGGNINPANKADKQKSEADKQKELAMQKEQAANKAQKEKALANYKQVIDKIDRFDDMFDNKSLEDYNKALNTASNMYTSFDQFDKEHSRDPLPDFMKIEFRGPLTPEQSAAKADPDFFRKDRAKPQFKKNTQAAHSHYDELKESIQNIKPQIEEIKSITTTTESSLKNLSLADLEKLHTSASLKKLHSRFHGYEATYKKVQHELKNKHKVHRIESENSNEIDAYNKLESKMESLHGLDTVINATRAAIDKLERSIKAEIKARKRDGDKVASPVVSQQNITQQAQSTQEDN